MWSEDVAPSRRKNLFVLLVTMAAIILSVVFWGPGKPSGARPILNPCQDGSCTTQTIRSGGFYEFGQVFANGHQATVSGPLTCGPGKHYVVTVELEQDGVSATGRSQGPCEDGVWVVRVHTSHGGTLVPGVVDEACGTLRTYLRDQPIGAADWCVKNKPMLNEA